MKIIRYADAEGSIGLAWVDQEGQSFALHGALFEDLQPMQEPVFPAQILTPLDPVAIIGIALNYRKHVEETGRPMPERPAFFMKLPWVAQATDHPIVLPSGAARSEKVDYEGELAVIIGKECRNVSEAEALDQVFGYTCANDVSARDWQYEWGGGQFCRGKTFDTFCPLGPGIVTADEIPDPSTLHLKTYLNGQKVQDSSVSDLIFSVPFLISFLSASTTLLPGTVILTGTPSGVGRAATPPRFLQPGDTVTIEISNVGALVNPVTAALGAF